MASSLTDVIAREREAVTATGGTTKGTASVTPADVRPERLRTFDPDAFPEVHGREEEWRFTPLDRLRPLLDGAESDAHLSWDCDVPAGAVVTTEVELPPVPAPVDRVSALAIRRSGGAVVVRVPADTVLDAPVELRLKGTGSDEVVWGHVVIEVGAGSRATVVVTHEGSARYAAATSVLLAEGAALDFVSVQDWADDALHSAHTASRLGRDARLRSIHVTLGGDVVRTVETVELDAPGGEAELLGLAFADSGQHLEHRSLVDHSAPHCRSRVTYKTALQGVDAHTVWVGDVLIRAGAVGTDTYEGNRNLLLTPEARADAVPNLEIETGEIAGAGHASATGRFDDDQLFYLMSRGISADEARRMVVRGFFADVISRIGVPALEERLLLAVEAELERTALR